MGRNKVSLKLGLCAGRHEIPGISEYIFSEIPDEVVNRPYLMDTAAQKSLLSILRSHGYYVTDDEGEDEGEDETCVVKEAYTDISLDIFVTGLTVALIAALNVCRREEIPVTLWHWDKDANNYFSQKVE